MKNAVFVLVVDDEEMMRGLIERILSEEGYRVLTAGDGVEALEILQDHHCEIIVTDIRMPRMDGFELLRAVRQDYPNTGVVIMTAYGDTYAVKDALLLGADEYITKPFKSYEIAIVVERAYWRILSEPGDKDRQVK